jgi:hypothetical protein
MTMAETCTPCHEGNHRDDGHRRKLQAGRREQNVRKQRHRAEYRRRNEPVRPQQRPSGKGAGHRPEIFRDVDVQRAGCGRPARELIDVEGDEDEHDSAERVGQPRAVSGVREHVRGDQDRGHARADQRNRGR